MYAKIIIQGTIEIVTGLHIGGSDAFAAIGAVDSPVIKDALTKDPIIPGSSLKGKMRTLLARALADGIMLQAPSQDVIMVQRLFGATRNEGNILSRLIFSDCFLTNKEQLKAVGTTEVKFENTINRLSGVATPRQIERVVRGAQFGLRLVYDLHDPAELEEDFYHIALAMALLQQDYLGGHGTRGSGQIRFLDITLSQLNGSLNAQQLATLKGVIDDAI